MRLMKFDKELDGIPFYVMPIEHKILFNQEAEFNNTVIESIRNFKKPV